MRRYGLVLVLYHPDAVALANLEHARASCAELVVVDNTPVADGTLLARLRADGTTVLANANQGGLARAHNLGVELLIERGCDLCFLLDQDSDVPDDYFERMVSAVELLADEALVIGPLVYETRLDRYFPEDLQPDSSGPGPWRRTRVVISSGSAVTAAAFRRLGPFREDLFIEYLDTEYSIRAEQAGVPLYVNTDLVLRQRTGEITVHGHRHTTNHVAWRRYYLVRNVVGVARDYGVVLPLTVGSRLVLRELATVVRFEQDKVRKIVGILVGAVDGLRRRMGRFEDNHLRIASYCGVGPRR